MDLYTFSVYTFIMFFCVFTSKRLTNPIKNNTKQHLVYSQIIIIIYTLIVGLRYKVGIDYQNYYDWYKTLYITGKFPIEDPDIGYYYLNEIVKCLGLHYCFIFIALAYGLIYSLLKAVSYTRFLYPLYFFFFFTIIFNESLNVMRQVMAFYIWYYAYTLYFNKKIRTAIIIALIGILFHKSSIIALFWVPFISKDIFKNRFITIILLTSSFVLGSLFYENIKIVLTLLSVFGGRLGSYLTEEKLNQFEEFTENVETEGIAVVIYLCINIIIVLFSNRLKQEFKNYKFTFFYNLFIIGQLLNPIVAANTILARANYYFDLHKIIILSFFTYYLWYSKSCNKFYTIIYKCTFLIILLIYLVLHYRHIANNHFITPYQTIFSI